MRHRPARSARTARLILGTVIALSLAAGAASTVLAGGWAEVKADAATTAEPPIEGQPTEIGFTVLQHGVTPAGWVDASVVLTDLASGETMTVKAAPGDERGHFSVPVTLPRAGLWTWSVEFDDLLHDARAFPLTVRLADGSLPAVDPAITLAAIDQARSQVTEEVNGSLSMEVSRIDGAISMGEIVDGRHTSEIAALTARLDAVETGATAGGGVPVPIVVLLALLGGATAGFVMAWLAGRPGTREIEVSAPATSPRGSTTA